MYKPKYIVNLNQVSQISDSEQKELQPVVEKFAFRTNEYYQGLINWDDPDDPIRKIVIPWNHSYGGISCYQISDNIILNPTID